MSTQPNLPARKVEAYTASEAGDSAQDILDGMNNSFEFTVGEPMLLDSPQAVIDRVAQDGQTVQKLWKITIEQVGTTE